MKFWVGWEMWQKLCFVLAGILAVVLAYSFCVLLRNRRKLSRATAEAYQKAEHDTEAQDGELRPMLTRISDIPFGARALQRGVQVEGIWISSSEAVDQLPKEPAPAISPPSTPVTTGSPLKKASLVDVNDDKEFLPPTPQVTAPLRALNGNGIGNEGAPSLSTNIPRASLHSIRTAATHLEPRASHEPGPRLSRQWFGPRSSWLNKAPEIYKRKSGVEGRYVRPSSEEIRRRFSKLFDEQLQVQPMETFQLGPMPLSAEGDKKRVSRSSRL
ncbi:hypothetical protein SI65_02703 [Aspergillus cristatus]|uniref:Uncharacterized protein n=1 Tax=Aspergillus cristatus TaxID=573508 RepID=A0A1E3BLQ4_ASPCR|nr:hypothetical protein SI65_02703 [Aspergillus cristatus]